jgi:PAS domain S-box-containing protein
MSPDLLYLYDLVERRNIYANREIVKVLGYSPEQIQEMGDRVFEITLHPDDATKVAKHHETLSSAEDEVLEIEYRIRDSQGRWRWLHSRDKAFSRAEDGTVRQIIGIAKDVTGCKQVEQALASRLDTERFISQILSDFVNLSDREIDRGITRTIERLARLAGATRASVFVFDKDLTVTNTHEWCEAPEDDSQIGMLQRIPAQSFGYYLDILKRLEAVRICRLDDLPPEATGERDWCERHGFRPLLFAPMVLEGALYGAVGFYGKINEQIQWRGDFVGLLQIVSRILVGALQRLEAERALHQSQERYKSFIDHSSEGIYRVDIVPPVSIELPREAFIQAVNQRAMVAEVNHALAKMYGLTPGQMLDRRAIEFAPNYGERVCLMLRSEGYKVSGEETQDVDKDGRPVFLIESFHGEVADGRLLRVWGVQRNVTDKKRAEKDLRESEEKHRRLVENLASKYFFYSHGPDGVFTYLSPSITGMLGYSPDEFMTHYTTYLTDNPINREVVEHTDGSIQGIKQPPYLVEIFDKSGGVHWLEITEVPIFDADGEVVAVEGVAHDITDNLRAQEELRKSQEQYKLINDASIDFIYSYDQQGRFTHANKSLCAALGITEGQFIGKTHADLGFPKEQCDEWDRLQRQVYETDSTVVAETSTPMPDGMVRYYEVNLNPLHDREGTIIGIAGVTRDITERKQAEARFRSEKAFTDSALDAQLDTFFLFEPATGKAMRWNKAFRDISGYSDEEIAALPAPVSYYSPEDVKRAGAFIEKVMAEGTGIVELELICKGGRTVPTEYRVSVVNDDSREPRFLISIGRDISERRRAEADKTRLEARLHQSQKMEAIGRLAGGVAHDFNNILTGITGYSEMMMSSIEGDDPLYADMDEVRKAAERAAGLTAQLLAFSRKQIIDPKVIQPNEVLQASQRMLRRIIGEDIDFIFSPAEDLWPIKVDPVQIDQIFVNLAVNARDAMQAGGKLTIETRNARRVEDDCSTFVGIKPGDYTLISVTDSGHGMDADTLAHIFEPFFSTKELGQGTGLGLSTVYGIVKQNGGFIHARSEVGIGTTFEIHFPAVMEAAEKLTRKQVPRYPVGTETVLLVEDDSMVRRLAKKILERHGYKVIDQDSGGRALVYVEKGEDAIDLLLTDVVMPGMSGKELHERLKEKQPDLKALFMSGYTEDIIAHHGVLEKGTELLDKPFNIESLTRKVREVLNKPTGPSS